MNTDDIIAASGSPRELENLFQKARAEHKEREFSATIRSLLDSDPDNTLLQAWLYRLESEPVKKQALPTMRSEWLPTIVIAIFTGLLFILLAGDKPPLPDPNQAELLFWTGWMPVTILAVAVFIWVTGLSNRRTNLVITMGAVLVVWALSLLAQRSIHMSIPILIATHAPFAVWALLGSGLSFNRPDPAGQFFSYMIKSFEALIASAIFLTAAGLFVALTAGILGVLGIHISEEVLIRSIAMFLGIVPVLAIASIYDAGLDPVNQSWDTGFSRILAVMSRLLMPLAIMVLLVYVLWLIPTNFSRGFQEREVLIIYNATIFAVIALLMFVVHMGQEQVTQRLNGFLRSGVLTLSALTIGLNLYSLAALVIRTLAGGITPNRQAFLGWNLITLLMLVLMFISCIRTSGDWQESFRKAAGLSMGGAVGWALWVIIGLPWTV